MPIAAATSTHAVRSTIAAIRSVFATSATQSANIHYHQQQQWQYRRRWWRRRWAQHDRKHSWRDIGKHFRSPCLATSAANPTAISATTAIASVSAATANNAAINATHSSDPSRSSGATCQ